MRRGAVRAAALAAAALGAAAGAAPAAAAPSLLPFPDDRLTRSDPGTPTGRRLDLPRAAMPRNAAGRPIDPRPYAFADGFSPGQPILARVAGVDLRRSRAVPVTDVTASLRRDQPVALVDARTGRRQLAWAERVEGGLLTIRPARTLRPGRRYVVGLGRLRDARGRVLRGPRRAVPRDVAAPLARAGLARRNLYRAWDFTVASDESLTGRLLGMRRQAFAALGDRRLADGRIAGR
ncbi:MAG TPA: hypothetical protein VK279_10990, partial [Solirubrobacteraceae bacterium]|nr:hypothetical protein [Solirubrobacteraceae bacterium]